MLFDYTKLTAFLHAEYEKKFPHSGTLQRRGEKVLIDGGSHAIRLSEPFPPRIRNARGAYIYADSEQPILDFWQGHHANILGHNPSFITEKLADLFMGGGGLQMGFADELQIECAEILCGATGAETVRFTTSGSLATMYATLLARAYSKKEIVLKIGGGWHGAQHWGLKGIDFHGGTRIFNVMDTDGLPSTFGDEVLVTQFNDCEMLEDQFRRHGNSIACFILEPFIGAGSIGNLYDIRPDLAAYGKIIGGGMPLSAVAGREEIMRLAGKNGDKKVRFSGGTYSAHPACLYSAKIMMQYLIDRHREVYPKINALGEKMRHAVEKAFRDRGIFALCTGSGNEAVPGSSIGMLFFPRNEKTQITTPESSRDDTICDTRLGTSILQTALLLQDVHVVHGLGSVSTAHTADDIAALAEACGKAADIFKRFSL